MALKSKTNEEPTVEQISFDDLEFDAEYVDEEEMSIKKYYTISGKESQYEPEWEKMKASELDIDDPLNLIFCPSSSPTTLNFKYIGLLFDNSNPVPGMEFQSSLFKLYSNT